MTPPVTPYTTVVSARSRRYRTIVTVLLATIVIMSTYGGFTVMPRVRQAVGRADTPRLAQVAASLPGPDLTARQISQAKRTLRARQVVVSLALAYWGVCSLLLLLVLLIAWLDFRETARNFALQSRALRQETVVTLQEAARRGQERGEPEDG